MVWNRFIEGTIVFAFIIVQCMYVGKNPFWDYDSVVHFQIAQEISSGTFDRWSQHAAPLAHLVYALVYKCCGASFVYFSVVLVAVGAVFTSSIFLKQYLPDLQTTPWILTLPLLTSYTYVHVSNSIGIEPATLLWFSVWWYSFRRWEKDASYYPFLIISGAMVLWNYKLILVLGFAFLRCISLGKSFLHSHFKSALLLLLWIPVLLIVALLLGEPPLEYFKIIAATVLDRSTITSGNSSTLDWSLFSHLHYWWYYENSLMGCGLLVSLVLVVVHGLRPNEWTKRLFLPAAFGVYGCIVTSILPAAPRIQLVWIPVYILLSCSVLALMLNNMAERIKHVVSVSVPLLLMGITLYTASQPLNNILRDYWSMQQNGYPKMAQAIQQQLNKKDTLYVVASKGIEPYLSQEDSIHVVTLLTETAYASIPSGQWILWDVESRWNGFSFIPFDSKTSVLASGSNACKRQPMLGLENAEYAGRNYSQVEAIVEENKRNRYPDLVLYKK
ncbi:MAG: hypothetical protein MUE33_08095 [Cytophagaceae bacterium]|nr:hypothetical protein [Cytophagaceae bacterium]